MPAPAHAKSYFHQPTYTGGTRTCTRTQNKTDGLYLDMFSPAFLALVNASAALAAPILPLGNGSASPELPVDVPALSRVEAAYAGYVRCAGGDAAARLNCPSGQFFNETTQECELSGLNQRANAAAVKDPVADPEGSCDSLQCACESLPDGLYPNPVNASAGLVCSGGVSKVYECPKGSVFGKMRDGRPACRPPKKGKKKPRTPSLHSKLGMKTDAVAGSPAPNQQPPTDTPGTTAGAGGAAPNLQPSADTNGTAAGAGRAAPNLQPAADTNGTAASGAAP